MIPHRSAYRVLWSRILARDQIARTGVQFLPIQNHEDAPYNVRALHVDAPDRLYPQELLQQMLYAGLAVTEQGHLLLGGELLSFARRSRESFLREQGLLPEEKLLDIYYQLVIYGCL